VSTIKVATKVAVAKAWQEAKATGSNLSAYSRGCGVQPSQVKKWVKDLKTLEKLEKYGGAAHFSTNLGRPSSLSQYKGKLFQWLFELRQKGMPVTYHMFAKIEMTRYCIVRRFLRSSGIVMRVATHAAQKAPQFAVDEAQTFLSHVRRALAAPNRDQRFIINMDQTPIYFSMEPKSTLALKETVNTRKSTSSTVRVTVAVAVTASGETLPWLLVFKGEPGKTIEKQMQKDGDDRLLYYAQGKAWMSEFVLHRWVDEVLAPWVATAPPGIVPYLLLDQYK
jgi:hypothetical protein